MKVERLDHFGRGIVNVDGKIGFIKNALIDEEIEIEKSNEHKKYFEGTSRKIKVRSSDRVYPLCKFYLDCGGCNLQHMTSSLKRKFKEDKVKEILSFLNSNINDLVYSNEFNYRNKVVLHVSDKRLGFYKNNSNELIEIDECLLLNNKINDIINYLKEFIRNEKFIDKITIKIGNITNEVMIIIDGNVDKYYQLLDICDVLIINDEVLTDRNSIVSYIGNKKYYVSRNSFFQINYDISTMMYDYIRKLIKRMNSKNVLDLYCGAGTIGIYISDLVDNVLGIEVVNDAILDANKNKELNRVGNINFMLGKVDDLIDDIKDSYDTIIVDPPRSGINKKVVDAIISINPNNIIYVSCDIMTLRRDLKILSDYYDILEVTPFDMFPNTYHVECVALLCLKDT